MVIKHLSEQHDSIGYEFIYPTSKSPITDIDIYTMNYDINVEFGRIWDVKPEMINPTNEKRRFVYWLGEQGVTEQVLPYSECLTGQPLDQVEINPLIGPNPFFCTSHQMTDWILSKALK